MSAVLRVLGFILAGLVLVLVVAAVAIYVVSESKLNRSVSVPTETVASATDTAAIQRGQHLAGAVASCIDCHTPTLGGKVFIDHPALGRVIAPNLTRGRGGVGSSFSDADYVRAIRHGVDPSGRPLLIMPADDYTHFSDADLGAIIGYVRSLPPVDNVLPTNELRWLGRILFATGQLPLQPADDIDHTAVRPASPPAGVTVEYGRYLAENAGCPSCHGPGLSGGKIPEAPPDTLPAANITSAGIGSWSEADFIKALRTGTRPDGRVLNTFMPWPFYAQMTDDELKAIWRFLQAVPPRATGTR
ncbi:MAG TPA: cytochrome c [Chloroflexota bacterium]|jgi:mono/diheme cytochrome c family protein